MIVATPRVGVSEPTLQLVVYVRNAAPAGRGSATAEDPRRILIQQAGQFAEAYAAGLNASYGHRTPAEIVADPTFEFSRADRLDAELARLTTPLGDERRLLNLAIRVADERERRAAMCRLRIYTSAHALIVQIAIGRYDPWSGTLLDGWRELRETLDIGFDGRFLDASPGAGYGASVVYWAMADDDVAPLAYAAEAAEIVAPPSNGQLTSANRVPSTQTDLGRLWHGDARVFALSAPLPQDTWVLVTPRLGDREQRLVNARYFDWESSFVRTSLSRLKFRAHQLEFEQDRPAMLRQEAALDDWAEQLLDTIDAESRSAEPAITHFRSRDSELFQNQVKAGANQLARYRAYVGELRRLRRTLHLARTNFLVNCTALIADQAAQRVLHSESHEAAAVRFLVDWQARPDGGDELFLRELGDMRGVCEQLDADLGYADEAIERNTGVLQSSTEQLQIAGQRELGEISHHMAIDSAAVVATLLAFIITEALVKPLFLEHTVVGLGLIISVASLTFTALVWLAEGRPARGRLVFGGLGVTLALVATTFIAWVGTQGELSAEHGASALQGEFAKYGAFAVALTVCLWSALRVLVHRRERAAAQSRHPH